MFVLSSRASVESDGTLNQYLRISHWQSARTLWWALSLEEPHSLKQPLVQNVKDGTRTHLMKLTWMMTPHKWKNLGWEVKPKERCLFFPTFKKKTKKTCVLYFMLAPSPGCHYILFQWTTAETLTTSLMDLGAILWILTRNGGTVLFRNVWASVSLSGIFTRFPDFLSFCHCLSAPKHKRATGERWTWASSLESQKEN